MVTCGFSRARMMRSVIADSLISKALWTEATT